MASAFKLSRLLNALSSVARSVALPHKASREEQDFVKENAKHWRGTSLPLDEAGAILVETALSTPASLLEKFLIAKTIEKRTAAQTVAILNAVYGQSNPAYGVARSFGVSLFVCWWRGYLHPWRVGRVLAQTLSLILVKRSGRALLDLRIDGIHIGDLMYDTLIRYRPNCYTVGKLSLHSHFRLLFRAIFNFHSSQALFRRYKVRAVVTSHNVYAEFGILCRIAHRYGAAIFLKDMDVFRVYDARSNVYEHFLRVSPEALQAGLADPTVVSTAEDYFNRRMNGAIDQVDLNNAYGNKQAYDKAELLAMFGADPRKKTVFVLAHAFSDAPHVGGKLAFDDYYDWLRQTLHRLSSNQDVNVIVKPHPSSYMWGEKGAVEVLLEELGTTNIHITPSDFSTLSIKSIADYVVTARGTAGLEYSGLGIPAVTCGEGYYSGFGIAHEHLERDTYFKALDGIATLPPLTPEVSRRARVLLYLTFAKLARSSLAPARHMYPGDNDAVLTPQHYAEITAKLRRTGHTRDAFLAQVEKEVDRAF
jgi:hypothetical protein